MDAGLAEIAKGVGVAAPFVAFLIWLVTSQAKTIREKDAEIARLNESDRGLVERIAPMLSDAVRVLGDATAELRRRE